MFSILWCILSCFSFTHSQNSDEQLALTTFIDNSNFNTSQQMWNRSNVALACNQSWPGLLCSNGSIVHFDSRTLKRPFISIIPTQIGLLKNLVLLCLAYNFAGSLPTDLGNLVSLTYFLIGEGNLEGSIPTEIGLLTSLQVFRTDGWLHSLKGVILQNLVI